MARVGAASMGAARCIAGPSIVRPRPAALRALRTIPRRSTPVALQQVRYNSSGLAAPPTRGIRGTHLFLGVMSIGLFVTIYGVLDWYFALTNWPEPVRKPLRNAIKFKHRGDYTKSEKAFREAIEAALSLEPSALAPDPLLKLSGIYIALAGMYEDLQRPIQAYTELSTALELFGSHPLDPDPTKRISADWAANAALSEQDHIRAIGLSQKMGSLALQIASGRIDQVYKPKADGSGPKSWLEAAEYDLSGALSAMLRLGLSATTVKNAKDEGRRVVVGRDLELPEGSEAGGRVDRRGMGVTMEALAEVHAMKREYAVAGNLLIQAISTLLPPGSSEVPLARDRCQAAMLMTTVSSHALHPHTPQAIKASRSWSLRSLQIADQAVKELDGEVDPVANTVCRRAQCVALYNMGMLAEIEKDTKTALEYFGKALAQSREIAFAEGKRQANESIRRVRGAISSSS